MNTINKEKFYEMIGSSIVSKRKELGLTQIELANRIGMSRTSIVNIEKGRQYPPVHLLWEISYALDAKPAEILPEKTRGLYTIEEDTSLRKMVLSKIKKTEIAEESISKIQSFVLGV